MSISIDLSDEKLQDIASVAILQAIGEKQRDALIQEALKSLLTETKEGIYGRHGPTPIQEAFNRAVSGVARDVATEMLDNDEATREKIRSLINEVVQRVFDHERKKMVESMVGAFIQGLTQ